MIVIFSDTTDVHATAVETAARKRGSTVIRLNRDELHLWSLEFLHGEPLVIFNGRIYGVDEVHSIFVRRLPDRESFKDYLAMRRLRHLNTSPYNALA
jgi:hypothetical protein